MSNLCIIPARGGSKRIPKKNIKLFLGKPIIAYSIKVALETKLFDEIIVSTDDIEIAEISKKIGAQIPFFRSSKTSDDFATLSDVVEEVKNYYSKIGKTFDNICLILPTAPLIQIANIKKGLKILSDNDVNSVRPVLRFSYPIQRALKMNNHKIKFINSKFSKTRSQDLEPAFYDSGQFYWMKFDSGLKGDNKYGFEIKESEAQDIDTFEDWKIAEIKYNYLYGKAGK